MSTAYHLSPQAALAAAHSILMSAVLRDHVGAPAPLLYAAVEVADALEALERDAEGGDDHGPPPESP